MRLTLHINPALIRKSNHMTAQRKQAQPLNDNDLTFRKPKDTDGYAVHDLIQNCPPLDQNSVYAYLLLCTHHADTCVIVENDGVPVGFLSGYIPPGEEDTLFVWQVAVCSEARGLGLATHMLNEILSRPEMEHINQIKTTITRDNKASWRLFESFAESVDANCTNEVMFCRKEHFAGRFKTEHLVTIKPLNN